jgi:hypothetical protein
MTSRAGSLIVAVFLGGLALVAVILIIILTGGDGDDGGSANLQVSIPEGALVLLGEPLELRVTARDDEPITGIALIVDGALVTRANPFADQTGGTFSAILSWVPDRLGTVTLTIQALGLSGAETEREFRVEVTDSAERVRGAVQLDIVSPSPLQQIALGNPINILVRAQSSDPITRFDLEVDGVLIQSLDAALGHSSGDILPLSYSAAEEGFIVLRVVAFTTAGMGGIAELTIEVVPAGELPEDSTTTVDDADGADGSVRIVTPSADAEIPFEQNISLDVRIDAFETGALQSVDLFVNTLLTQSVRPEPRADGSYSFILPFSPGTPGLYALEVVATSESSRRFDFRIDVTLTADDEPPPDDEIPPDDEEPPEDEVETPPQADLTPLSVTVGEGNTILLTIQNSGSEPFGPVPVLFSVIRTADGLLLGEELLVLALAAGEIRLLPLPIGLTEAIDITVVVDTANAVDESNEDNNTITTVFEPLSRPDLAATDLQISSDLFPIVSLLNAGENVAAGPISVLILFNGVATERLTVGQDLGVQGSLTLAGSIPIEGEGQLSAIVDPDNTIAEADESNNSITITIESQAPPE